MKMGHDGFGVAAEFFGKRMFSSMEGKKEKVGVEGLDEIDKIPIMKLSLNEWCCLFIRSFDGDVCWRVTL